MTNYGESATIKKPEVGDIWNVKGHIIRLEQIGRKYSKEYFYFLCQTPNGIKGYDFYTLSYIKSVGKYLGKSKAKISDLFEVQDD